MEKTNKGSMARQIERLKSERDHFENEAKKLANQYTEKLGSLQDSYQKELKRIQSQYNEDQAKRNLRFQMLTNLSRRWVFWLLPLSRYKTKIEKAQDYLVRHDADHDLNGSSDIQQ